MNLWEKIQNSLTVHRRLAFVLVISFLFVIFLVIFLASPSWINHIYWIVMPILLDGLRSIAKHFHEILLALVGTFFGAYAAFILERRDRERERLNEDIAQGNLALLTLWQMWEVVSGFKKSVVDMAPDDHGRWLNMNVTLPEQEHQFHFEPSKLYFLFESKDKQLLADLILEERRFYSLIQEINKRSDLMLNKVWPRLTAAGIERARQYYEVSEINRIVGAGYLAEARVLADGLVAHTNENFDSFQVTFKRLRAILLEQFPGKNFIKIDFDPSQTKNDPNVGK
jgi:hypothetical protein